MESDIDMAIRILSGHLQLAEASRRHEEGHLWRGESRHAADVVAYDLAIAALREKQQREKETTDA